MPPSWQQTAAHITGEIQNLLKTLRNTFQMAVAFSPLLVLFPKKLNADGI
jgi:hypothetical protein